MTKSICDLDGCNKKIKLVNQLMSTCYCGKTHCGFHRLSETHKCDYDFRSKINFEDKIKEMKCVASKIDNI
jgi:hypothetical protein